LENLHVEVEKIREKAGYILEDKLKFETNSKPEYVSILDFRKAKKNILHKCVEMGFTFIANVVLHDIIGNLPKKTQFEWAANPVIGSYTDT